MSDDGDGPGGLPAICRHALRETDAVMDRRADGVVAVLLRHVRPGFDDARTVADRLRRRCEDAGRPIRIGVAVAEADDEPLDLLLQRAEHQLAGRSDPVVS